jgi:hypothetical protein
MLLEIDGLDEEWSSEWTGEMGNCNSSEMPEAVRRLLNPDEIRQYDTSGMGLGTDSGGTGHSVYNGTSTGRSSIPLIEDNRVVVSSLNLDDFKRRLIEHFDICFQKREISWPSRNRVVEPNI